MRFTPMLEFGKKIVFYRGKEGEESFSVKFSHCIDGAAGVVLEGDNVEEGEDYIQDEKKVNAMFSRMGIGCVACKFPCLSCAFPSYCPLKCLFRLRLPPYRFSKSKFLKYNFDLIAQKMLAIWSSFAALLLGPGSDDASLALNEKKRTRKMRRRMGFLQDISNW